MNDFERNFHSLKVPPLPPVGVASLPSLATEGEAEFINPERASERRWKALCSSVAAVVAAFP